MSRMQIYKFGVFGYDYKNKIGKYSRKKKTKIINFTENFWLIISRCYYFSLWSSGLIWYCYVKQASSKIKEYSFPFNFFGLHTHNIPLHILLNLHSFLLKIRNYTYEKVPCTVTVVNGKEYLQSTVLSVRIQDCIMIFTKLTHILIELDLVNAQKEP